MKLLLPLVLLASLAHAGPIAPANPKAPLSAVTTKTRSTPWRVTAGPLWRQVGDVRFSNSSQAPAFILPQLAGRDSLSVGAYSDGFVQPDISGSGTETWNFGYTSNSQLVGTELIFHGGGTSFENDSTGASHNADGSENADGFGAFVQFESPELLQWRGISLSAEVGYSWTRSDTSHSATAFTATQRIVESSLSVTDRYNTLGAVIPGAPYTGSFNGPGPTISLNPTRQISSRVTNVEEFSVESIIHNELRVDLHTFSFGPHAAMEFGALRVSLSAGVALNIADTEASTREVLKTTAGKTLKTWAQESNDTEVLPGLYVEASAERPITARLSAFAAVRCDWAEKLEGKVGASRYSLDTGGLTAKVGVSFKF